MESRYTPVYAKDDDGIRLVRYRLNPGCDLYEIEASYSKTLEHSPTTYYAVAASKKQAKTLFQNKFPWLDAIFSITLCDEATTEEVTNNPPNYIVV